MVCIGLLTLTASPLGLSTGACTGTMTVDLPGVGTTHITAGNPIIAFTTVPGPVLTITTQDLTVEFTPHRRRHPDPRFQPDADAAHPAAPVHPHLTGPCLGGQSRLDCPPRQWASTRRKDTFE